MSAHTAIGDAFNFMSQDMRGKLGVYMTSLEHRYGDPVAYAAQREEMAAEQAAVIHSEVKTREEALSAAYNTNRERIRNSHKVRMAQLARDKPPRYLEVGPDEPPDQTDAPPSHSDPRRVKGGRAPRPATAR